MRIEPKIFCIAAFFIFFGSCKKNSDNTYFSGEILPIDSDIKQVKNMVLKPLQLEGAYFGIIAAYDSLMFFMNNKLPNHFFNVFNINTGEEIGTFCNRGGGPGEVAAISPIYQFFKEDDALKTLLYAPNENELLIWNITRSLEKGTTVLDTIIPYPLDIENQGAFYDYIFRQDENTLFTNVQSIPLNDEEATLPFYQKRTVYDNRLLKNYSIYKNTIRNEDASIIPEAFLSSNDVYKADGSRIIQFMLHLAQLNIIDTETGKVIGYRMLGSPDFSFFEKEKRLVNNYYLRARADDQYIYASYWGKESWGPFEIPSVNTIHVFDWNGKWLYELITDQPIHEMWLDKVRNRLYTTNVATDEVFYLDLNEIKLTGK